MDINTRTTSRHPPYSKENYKAISSSQRRPPSIFERNYKTSPPHKQVRKNKEKNPTYYKTMSMQRFLSHQISSPLRRIATLAPPCDVFINHRGVDTKKTVAGLLYHRLSQLNINAFLDSKSMQPGDRLYESIGSAIRKSKIGVVVFSPRYCDSYFCLHELALLVDQKKKLIPIFCDVKPSELQIMAYEKSTPKELVRFRKALEEARYTVGFVFDSQNGNWSELVTNASDIIVKSLNEEKVH